MSKISRNQKIDPLRDLEVKEKKEDVLTKKIRNMIRVSIFLLLMASFSDLSSHINLDDNIQYILSIALATDLCGIQLNQLKK